jgi:hypothetical protein
MPGNCTDYCLQVAGLIYTPSVSKQKLRFTKSMGLRSVFAFLARNRVRCIALTKRFPVS